MDRTEVVSFLRFSYLPHPSGSRSIVEFLACFHQTCFHHVPYAVFLTLSPAPFLRLRGVRPVISFLVGPCQEALPRGGGSRIWLVACASFVFSGNGSSPLYKLLAPLQCPALFIGIPSQHSLRCHMPKLAGSGEGVRSCPWKERRRTAERVSPRVPSDCLSR